MTPRHTSSGASTSRPPPPTKQTSKSKKSHSEVAPQKSDDRDEFKGSYNALIEKRYRHGSAIESKVTRGPSIYDFESSPDVCAEEVTTPATSSPQTQRTPASADKRKPSKRHLPSTSAEQPQKKRSAPARQPDRTRRPQALQEDEKDANFLPAPTSNRNLPPSSSSPPLTTQQAHTPSNKRKLSAQQSKETRAALAEQPKKARQFQASYNHNTTHLPTTSDINLPLSSMSDKDFTSLDLSDQNLHIFNTMKQMTKAMKKMAQDQKRERKELRQDLNRMVEQLLAQEETSDDEATDQSTPHNGQIDLTIDSDDNNDVHPAEDDDDDTTMVL